MRASNKVQTALIEVEDIREFDSLPPTGVAEDDIVEIELTAEQMDAMLSGK